MVGLIVAGLAVAVAFISGCGDDHDSKLDNNVRNDRADDSHLKTCDQLDPDTCCYAKKECLDSCTEDVIKNFPSCKSYCTSLFDSQWGSFVTEGLVCNEDGGVTEIEAPAQE